MTGFEGSHCGLHCLGERGCGAVTSAQTHASQLIAALVAPSKAIRHIRAHITVQPIPNASHREPAFSPSGYDLQIVISTC